MGSEAVTPESRQPFEGLHPKRGEREWQLEKDVGQRGFC